MAKKTETQRNSHSVYRKKGWAIEDLARDCGGSFFYGVEAKGAINLREVVNSLTG